MKNKILIALFTILTFGLFLIPRTFAFSTSQLDNVNRVVNIGTFGTSSTPTIYFNYDNNNVSSVYITIQCFSRTDLNTPVNINSIGITPQFNTGSAWQNMTSYTTNNNYAYRTQSLVTINPTYSYLVLNGATNITDYVFNICLVKQYQNGLIGHFVPNSYYSIEEGKNGIFYNARTYLVLEGSNNETDVTDQMIGYNNIKLGSLVNSVYNVNNVNSYQYHLYLRFENGISIKNLPNISIKFLQLDYININGTLYTYAQARNNYSWLYNNIVLYNDSASLYVSNDSTVGFGNNVIYEIRFTLPNYSFKSSSYYDSTLGLKGYLQGVSITSFDYTNYTAYDMGYEDGFNYANSINYDSAYNDGFNAASKTPRSSLEGTILAVADTPLTIIDGFLNFEILGTNIKSFVFAIVSLMLFVYLFRKFKE